MPDFFSRPDFFVDALPHTTSPDKKTGRWFLIERDHKTFFTQTLIILNQHPFYFLGFTRAGCRGRIVFGLLPALFFSTGRTL